MIQNGDECCAVHGCDEKLSIGVLLQNPGPTSTGFVNVFNFEDEDEPDAPARPGLRGIFRTGLFDATGGVPPGEETQIGINQVCTCASVLI